MAANPANDIQAQAQKEAVGAAVQVVKDNPELQKELAQQAQGQAAEYGRAAGAAWTDSFMAYVGLAGSIPDLKALCSTEVCKGVDDWTAFFGKWNLLWFQFQVILAPIVLVLGIVFSIFSASFPIIWILQRIIMFAASLVLSHMAYWCVVEKGGCCGGTGYACWVIFYFLMMIIFVIDSAPPGVERGYILSLIALIQAIPSIYLMIACWQLGGGDAIINCGKSTATMAKGAYDANRARASEQAAGQPAQTPQQPLMSQAPAASPAAGSSFSAPGAK